MTSDPIHSAMHAALGPLFARMSRSQEVAFMVDGQRYDVACAAGDTVRVIEASLRCAVAAMKAGGVNNIVFSDWNRDGAWWFRSSVDGSVYVTDQAERSVFRVLVCSTLLGGTFTCPDAAREAADAHLVSTGRLDKARAFVRLGEWEEDGVSYHRTKGGTPCHHAYMVAQKAEVDAELVRRGLLAEERAFKVARPKLKPLAWDVGGGVTAVTGLAFGNAVPNTAVGIDYASAHGNTTTAVVVNKRADGVSEVVGYAQDITKMSDDEINAMYGKNSEVARAMIGAKRFAEQGRTTTVVSGDGKPLGTYYAITPDDIKRAEERIAAKQAVTLTNWERCLPMLLSDAPREFRDGFNRRQGPAWEAYLRALAWVKEQMQCKRVGAPNVREAITMAALTAQGYLGPEWVKANVR